MKRHKLNNPKTTIAFFFLIMLLGCASNQSLSTNVNKTEKVPEIIFLNYAIKKTSNKDRTVHFINKIIAEGKLKNYKKNSKEDADSGDLICYQLDKRSNILQSTIIKNPLFKTIEYVDESKSFQIKKVDLDSAQFSLRLQLKPNTKYISINLVSGSKNKTKPLIKTKLN